MTSTIEKMCSALLSFGKIALKDFDAKILNAALKFGILVDSDSLQILNFSVSPNGKDSKCVISFGKKKIHIKIMCTDIDMENIMITHAHAVFPTDHNLKLITSV